MSPCLFLIYNATFIQFLSLFRVSGAHFPMHIVLAISMAVNIIFNLNNLKVESFHSQNHSLVLANVR